MTTQTFNVMAFTLTILIAVFLCVLAVIVYLKGKREFQNITSALTLVFAALFISSGFAEKILVNPSDSFTLFAFQWSFATGLLALLFYFLLILSLYLGRTPKKSFLIATLLIALPGAALSFSPWFMTNAHYGNGTSTSSPGPLCFIVPALTLFLCSSCIVTAIAAKRKAIGINRARLNIIFMGLMIFIPFPLIFSYILPAITGNAEYANYTFFASVIPISLLAYAILRLRLLDMRLILRKTGLLLTFLCVLATPAVLLLIALSGFELSASVTKGLLFALFLLLLGVSPFLWKWMEHYSSRLFFSGLYDSGQLKRLVEKKLTSSSDLAKAIPSTLHDLIVPLALETLAIFILPGVLADYSILYQAIQKGTDITPSEKTAVTNLENILCIEKTIVAEELRRWPHNQEETELGQALMSKGITACIPLKLEERIQGYFLLGPKIGKTVLSLTDINCLEDIGNYFGLYFDNYGLSAQLSARLAELEKVYEELQKADDFKTEIINLTSHELRTPLTILNSFTQILIYRYSRCSEAERLQYLGHIKESCERLGSIVSQFLTVSNLQKGAAESDAKKIYLADLFNEVKNSFKAQEQTRIKIDCDQADLRVFSDGYYLLEMLKHLTENALRFSPDCEPVVLAGESHGALAQISVEDSGDGIDPTEAKHIFDPFTRLEDLDRHHAGIGLGLYSVRLMADLLGTEITVKAESDEVTSFTFLLPKSKDIILNQ